MRIAYITETWLPSVDGIITRLLATIGELRAQGAEVLVIAPESARPALADVTVRTVPTIRFRFVYGGQRWGLPLPRVGRYLEEFRPDVVHLLNPVLIGWAGAISAQRRGYPVVASYHTDLERYAAGYRLSWIVPLLRAHLRKIHGSVDLNLATSATGQSWLRSQGVSEPKLWPAGVNLDLYHPGDKVRPDHRSGGMGTHVRRNLSALYVGRVAAEKGLHHLTPLVDAASPYHLTIVGDGPARRSLHANLGPNVTFRGTLSGPTLADAYRKADVFVFPSTTETLGLVLLEALASGLPVVAYESPASRDILKGCPAARLIPAGEITQLIPAITDLLASNPRAELARMARAHVRHMTWRNATTTLLDHYEAAILTASPTLRSSITEPVKPVQTSIPKLRSVANSRSYSRDKTRTD